MTTTDATSLPALFRRHIRRPRLTNVLDETAAQSVLLIAPAGYGKTTLAAEWLQGRDEIAWYRATPASADVAALSVGVADAVASIIPSAGRRLKQRVRAGDAPEKAVRSLAELLAEDLSAWPDDAWLVLDDYHLVMDSTVAETLVDWVLALSPVKLVITSRRRPSWATARRVLYGEIFEVSRDELAMTEDEAREVLSIHPREAIGPLVEMADGWPALLGLAALTPLTGVPKRRVSDALFRYFAEEVLRSQPADDANALLLVSVPPTLTNEIVGDILPGSRGPLILDRLLQDGLLHRTEAGFRFHPLLRDFLLTKLAVERPRLLACLYRRAIAAARASGRLIDAFSLALQSKDMTTAADVLGDAAPALLSEGRLETVEGWLAASGVAAFTSPSATLARAEVLTRRGSFYEASALARSVAERARQDDEHSSRAWFLTGQAEHLLSNYSQAHQLHLRAFDSARKHSDRVNALWGAFLSATELSTNPSQSFLDQMAHAANSDINVLLRIEVGQLLAAERSGSLSGVSKRIPHVRRLIAEATDAMARTFALTSIARVHVLSGQFSSARAVAQEALELCRSVGLDFAISYCLADRGVGEVGARDHAAARKTLEGVQRAARDHEDPHAALEAAILSAKLSLSERGPRAALAERIDFPDSEVPHAPHADYLALCALLHAAAGDLKEAISTLKRARSRSHTAEAAHFGAFAELIVDSAGNESHPSIITRTTQLVFRAEKAECLAAFVFAYRCYPVMLKLLRESDARGIVRRAVTRSNDWHLAHNAGLDLSQGDRQALLTPRETEVYRLVVQGFSNAAIAERLVISRSTVKVHVHNILEKLGARSRVEVAVSAREWPAP